MAWQKLTETDLTASLSHKEIETYRQSCPMDGTDPVEALLKRTAQMIRGYIRKNTGIIADPTEATIPESLTSPAIDYATYDILKRFPVPMTDERKQARSDALALFQAVARGDIIPESSTPEDSQAMLTTATPLAGDAKPTRLLD